MPSTSRIRATWPSPMMVAPAYTVRPFNCLPSGLTTISCGVVDAVDHQPELPVFGLQDHDVDGVGPLRPIAAPSTWFR